MPNWIDTVFLVFLVVVVLKTFRGGTFWAVVEVLAFFASIYLAEKICQSLIFNAKIFTAANAFAYASFFVFFFFAAYAILRIILWLISKMIKVEILGVLDKVLAAALGVLIALLNAGLLFNVAYMFSLSPSARAYLQTSQVEKIATPTFNTLYEAVFSLVPQAEKLIGGNLEKKVSEKIEAGKEAVEKISLPKLKELNLPELSTEKLNELKPLKVLPKGTLKLFNKEIE